MGAWWYGELLFPASPQAATSLQRTEVIPKRELTPGERATQEWYEESRRRTANAQQCGQMRANPLAYRADRQGHFWLNVVVNGVPVRFVLDTGATGVALTLKDAEAAGISGDQLDYSNRVKTANGDGWVAPVKLREIRVEQLSIKDMPAVVGQKLSTSLLGMSFLRRFHFEISGDVLTITCGSTTPF
jgi:aspartyl protease family protein